LCIDLARFRLQITGFKGHLGRTQQSLVRMKVKELRGMLQNENTVEAVVARKRMIATHER